MNIFADSPASKYSSIHISSSNHNSSQHQHSIRVIIISSHHCSIRHPHSVYPILLSSKGHS